MVATGQRRLSGRLRRHVRTGVTLLEVVLAMGILVVVSSMTYWFYASALETSRGDTEVARKLRLARSVLDRMSVEIRQAASMAIDKQMGIKGEAEQIWLSSYRVPRREIASHASFFRPEPPPQYDLAKVEYRIVRHPEIQHEDGWALPLGLARVEGLIPRPEQPLPPEGEAGDGSSPQAGDAPPDESLGDKSPGDESSGDEFFGEGDAATLGAGLDPFIDWDELYAPEIRYLRFCYYDGKKWWDRWEVQSDNPLPQLVQVVIGFTGQPSLDENVFQNDKTNEEFCTCLNKEPVDCVPLAADQFSIVVRVPQADPLFRSRVNRETQALTEDLLTGGGDEP